MISSVHKKDSFRAGKGGYLSSMAPTWELLLVKYSMKKSPLLIEGSFVVKSAFMYRLLFIIKY